MHKIKWSGHARRALRKFDHKRKEAIHAGIQDLAAHDNPFLHGHVEKIKKRRKSAHNQRWRLRVGDTRVSFLYEDEVIIIVDVSKRTERTYD